MTTTIEPVVGVVMGSSSDWEVMQHAVAILKDFGVAHEAQVISAHRMPDQLFDYAKSARPRGLRAIIAGAVKIFARRRFAAIDCPNAQGRTGGDFCHW